MKRITYIFFCTFCFAFVWASNGLNKVKTNKGKAKSLELAQIGHQLFFDLRLSKNGMKSCATCHAPEYAFTDGYRRTMNIEAELLKHNTLSVLNLGKYQTLNWANPTIKTIAEQMSGPLFAKHPIELGMDYANENALIAISNDQNYKPLLADKNIEKLTWDLAIQFISEYVSLLNARNSKIDQFRNNKTRLNKDELAGKNLFYSPKLNCVSCHNGIDFNEPKTNTNFANIGLYNIGSTNDYANNDNGLFDLTQKEADKGKFRIPSLRNVAVTAPYFHDGSITTLAEVIAIFSKGGQHIQNGPYAGNGIKHPNNNIKPFKITPTETKQLVSFLNTLTDTSYLINPFFVSPFNTNQ